MASFARAFRGGCASRSKRRKMKKNCRSSMDAIHPIVRSALTGFFSALLLAIPVGPVNLTIINEGARRGFKWAVLITLGATTMEVIYCFIAFTGLASILLTGEFIRSAMELFSFVFMLG